MIFPRHTRKRPYRDRPHAFTILEVMLAGSVMALAIATSITTMQRAFASLDTARNLVLAGQIMQTELEKLRMQSWTTVSAYYDSAQPQRSTPIDLDANFTDYAYVRNLAATRGLALSRTVTSPSTGMLLITYTVAWRSYEGRGMSRSYSTYYSQYGLYDYFYNGTT